MRFPRSESKSCVSGAIAGLALIFAAGCGAPGEDGEPLGQRQEAVSPPAQAHCSIVVQGHGEKSMEDDYLPHVITCENGGANLQALKAQAIAARSVAYYAIATSGSICDGQGCQVYSCGAAPQAKHYQAVKETAGQYLSFANMLTYGFYVAGDSNAGPPGCKDYGGTTTKYVTYNEGKTGGAVTQTSLGYIGPPGYGQNRGCMGQWGARCLENSNGYDYKQILQFYYGADIGIVQATGPCVGPQNQVPAGYLDEAGCTSVRGWAQDADEPGKSIDVHLYFGGPAGSGAVGKPLAANVSRSDLCAPLGSCEHGFELRPPLSLFDGQPHAVHAYAIDSAGGANAELAQSPATLGCPAAAPQGVRRHVTNPESLAAWKLDLFWSLLPLDDATIAAIPEEEALPAGPALIQADDGSPEVWLVDGSYRRHVPDPGVLAAWGFSFGDVQVKPAAEVSALTLGPPVRPYPVLVQASSGKVDLIDDSLDSGSAGSAGSGGGGATGAGGAGKGGASASKGGGAGVDAKPGTSESDDGSCGCRVAGAPTSSSRATFGALALALLFALRRRRSAVLLAAGAVVLLPARADALSRCEVMKHAKAWVDKKIMYSQGPSGGYCPGSYYCDPDAGGACYRPDCSGFVSAVWGLPAPGHTTYSFAGGPWNSGKSHIIALADLKPGDALNFGGNPSAGTGHIVLFGGWLDGVGGKLWAYETGTCGTPAHYSERSWSSMAASYDPIRLNGITDGADDEKCNDACECKPRLDASFVAQGSDAQADDEGKAYYKVCAGAPVSFWFELENTGADSWVDWSGSAWGQAVRLGVVDDSPDPFVGKNRISVSESDNDDVHPASWDPPGGDCSDQAFCRRTVIGTSTASPGTAPATPGVYTTKWRLVDEGRGWFGPEVWLSFNVVSCETGSGGQGGAAGGTGSGASAGSSGAGSSGGWGGNGAIQPMKPGSPGTQQKTSVVDGESSSGCSATRGRTERSEPLWLFAVAALGVIFARRR